MSGIAGFYQSNLDFTQNPMWQSRLESMKSSLLHRGPDENGILLFPHAGLAQTHLAVREIGSGRLPMQKKMGDGHVSIVYDGELFNRTELKDMLTFYPLEWESKSDAEIILNGYMAVGFSFFQKLNGVFAFAVYDTASDTLMLVRDPLGAKPLFFQQTEDCFIFGSEAKALFAYGIQPKINLQSFQEIFGLGPARTPGLGVFSGMHEVLPGHIIVLTPSSCTSAAYFCLRALEHTDSYTQTVEKTTWLVTDSILRQMEADAPICTFLSGGLDSSLVSAVCAHELKKQGKTLDTFSFDFRDNASHFQPNSFQSTLDRPFVDIMADTIHSNHTFLECDSITQADYLYQAVDARDLPCMADVESSLLYFCSLVAGKNKVALTGECADELFGGYPWFHREELWSLNTFPWSSDLSARTSLLKADFLEQLKLPEYVAHAYETSLAQTPHLEGEDPLQKRLREISWLNIQWFMATLLNRMDRAAAFGGMAARIPFADLRILQYTYNIPWSMKRSGGVVKHLLVEAGRDYLPDAIRHRKKSPYPKTYDSGYEKLLASRLTERLSDSASPLASLLDPEKTKAFIAGKNDYGKPWYGQLMAGPQMLAYLLQLDYWMEKYKLNI